MKLGLGLETGGNGSQSFLCMRDGQTEYKQILKESEAGHSRAQADSVIVLCPLPLHYPSDSHQRTFSALKGSLIAIVSVIQDNLISNIIILIAYAMFFLPCDVIE